MPTHSATVHLSLYTTLHTISCCCRRSLFIETLRREADTHLLTIKATGEEEQRWSAGTWSIVSIERLLGSVAMAVQRGNALTMLSGVTSIACVRAERVCRENEKSGSLLNVCA